MRRKLLFGRGGRPARPYNKFASQSAVIGAHRISLRDGQGSSESAIAMRVNRSDLQDTTSAGLVRCTAKVGRASVKVQAVFPEDIAGCVGTAPKSAKRKTIKVTISLTLDGVTVSRTASVRVN